VFRGKNSALDVLTALCVSSEAVGLGPIEMERVEWEEVSAESTYTNKKTPTDTPAASLLNVQLDESLDIQCPSLPRWNPTLDPQ